MKKPAIPPTSTLDPKLSSLLEPIKQNIEAITGARPGSVAITSLASTASLADVITAVNKLLSRINQSG